MIGSTYISKHFILQHFKVFFIRLFLVLLAFSYFPLPTGLSGQLLLLTYLPINCLIHSSIFLVYSMVYITTKTALFQVLCLNLSLSLGCERTVFTEFYAISHYNDSQEWDLVGFIVQGSTDQFGFSQTLPEVAWGSGVDLVINHVQ